MRDTTRPPLILPALLIVLGVVLLLSNFLILDGLDLARYWPVLIIAVGAFVLLRGDLFFTKQAQPFGITRGNVQTAQLEASSGELDIQVRPLEREGRLIAGQYTARSRPTLGVRGTHARLTMQRGQTWLLSMADWQIELAPDLPWSLLLSAFLGNIDAALEGVTLDRGFIGTGFGDIRLTLPASTNGGLQARSTFGDIRTEAPPETAAIIRIGASRLSRLRVDETRYLLLEPGVYATLNYAESSAPVTVTLRTAFGTITLA